MRKLPRVLIVEDEPAIAELIAVNLRHNGFQPFWAEDGDSAQRELDAVLPDVILLDWMLPGQSGLSLARKWRADSRTKPIPILMLTARGDEPDKVAGLDAGADDYITKPFSMPVLLRKIGAILRRCRGEDRPGANLLRYRDLTLDLDAYTAMRGDRMLELTNREFECLRELLQNQGRVMTYQMLVSCIWNYDYLGDDRVIYSHIKNLRRKLGADYIRTVRGVGYRVDKD